MESTTQVLLGLLAAVFVLAGLTLLFSVEPVLFVAGVVLLALAFALVVKIVRARGADPA